MSTLDILQVQQPNEQPHLRIKPIISYPREAQVGKSYLLSIDLQLAVPFTWPYPEEEYPITFVLDTLPYFSFEPIGEQRPSVVIHRFGGTYGPAEYLLMAARQEFAEASIGITFLNGAGLPITRVKVECAIKQQITIDPQHAITIKRKSRAEKRHSVASLAKEVVAASTNNIPELVVAGIPAHSDMDSDDVAATTGDVSEQDVQRIRREAVEDLLVLAGWIIQDYVHADIRDGCGVAIRNFPIRAGTGDAEPLHFLLLSVDQQVAGIVVIVEEEQSLISIEQTLSLSHSYPLLQGEKPRRDPLPFTYGTNIQGTRVRFTNYLDPVIRTRSIFAFHRPETLALWLQQAPANATKSQTDLLRAQLRRMPELEHAGLRDAQYDVIVALEKSLAEGRQRTLIQIASTESSKTFAMISSIYRLLKFGNARRILYLTDSDGRDKYAYAAFQRYLVPGESLFPNEGTFPGSNTFPGEVLFSELYNVQFIPNHNKLMSDIKVQISSIQRLVPQLFKVSTLKQYNAELAALSKDWSAFGKKSARRIVELLTNIQDMLIDVFDGDKLENATYLTHDQQSKLRDLLSGNRDLEKLMPEILVDYIDLIDDLLSGGISVTNQTIQYNPDLPIDAFDIVVIDECTRRIIDETQLRSILGYFDAFLIGLTEETDPKVVNFFNNNVVSNRLIDGLDRPATAFLSYAREDEEAVKEIRLRLKVRGVRCWPDVDDMSIGNQTESEIERAIEHDADAIALFLTPSFLQSSFIWRVEVPAALRRQKADPHFHIVPILLGVTIAEVRQFCYNRNLTDVTSFNSLLLSGNGVVLTSEEVNTKRNEAARRILQSAFALRLRRSNADRNYEPTLFLRTFVFTSHAVPLDLSLDWLNIIYEKEHVPTLQEWDETLWPALLDVKHTISKEVHSRRIHLYVKGLLSVAIAFGFVFRESARITLLLEGQKETWSTETRPSEEVPLLREWIFNDQGEMHTAVIEVATTRSTKQGVDATLPKIGLTPEYHIRFTASEVSREFVRDAAHARAIAQQVGQMCQHLCDERQVAHIHLFVSIPVELAVLIGYQLNALCPITLYEFSSSERVYKPVAII